MLLLAWYALSSPAFACSIYVPKYEAFDAQEYVFYGKVTDYTVTLVPNCGFIFCLAWGWKIAVLQPVSVPSPTIREVEVYAFGLTSSCSREGYSRADVRELAVGTTLMIAARRMRGETPSSHPNLNVSGYHGPVFAALPAGADVALLAREEFSYDRPPDRDAQEQRQWQRRMEFELRKDLTRLETDRDPAQRKRVLTRLAQARWFTGNRDGDRDGPFRAAVQRYAGDAPTAQELLKLRENVLTSG